MLLDIFLYLYDINIKNMHTRLICAIKLFLDGLGHVRLYHYHAAETPLWSMLRFTLIHTRKFFVLSKKYQTRNALQTAKDVERFCGNSTYRAHTYIYRQCFIDALIPSF